MHGMFSHISFRFLDCGKLMSGAGDVEVESRGGGGGMGWLDATV